MPDDLTPQSPEPTENETESSPKRSTEEIQRVIDKLEEDDNINDHTAETLISGRQQFENALAEMRRKADEMAREQVKRQTGQLEIPKTPPVSELVEVDEQPVTPTEDETVIEEVATVEESSSPNEEAEPQNRNSQANQPVESRGSEWQNCSGK